MSSALSKQLLSLVIFAVVSALTIIFLSRYIDIGVNITKNENDSTENLEISDRDTEKSDSETTYSRESADADDPEEDFILKQTRDGETAYMEKIIFLGDKNTYSMGRYSYTGIPDPIRQVWSVENNVSPAKIMTVNNFIFPATMETTTYLTAVKNRAPAFLVLSFGSFDDGEEMTKDRLISAIGDFIVNIKVASPNTHIIIQSILPASADCEVITPEQVAERNEWLKELCVTYKVYYADVWSALCDENGILQDKFASTDGYLLNEDGYCEVVNYIRTHVHPAYANEN